MVASTVAQKRPRKQVERREESERKLFDALISIIIEEGIAAATCENIATQAGYSRGLTTTRLGRRDEMFAKLIQRLKDAQLDKLKRAINDEMSREQALRTYVDVHFDDLQNDPGYNAYFVLVAGSLTDTPLLRDSVIEAHEFVRDIIAQFIQEGIDSGEFSPEIEPIPAAIMIGSYLLGAAVQHRLHQTIPISSLKSGAYQLLPRPAKDS